MNLRKVTCLDGTSYKVGEVMAKGTVKEIFIKYLTNNLIEIQEFIDIWKLEEIRIDGKISEHETTLAKLEALLQSNIKVSNDFIAELLNKV